MKVGEKKREDAFDTSAWTKEQLQLELQITRQRVKEVEWQLKLGDLRYKELKAVNDGSLKEGYRTEAFLQSEVRRLEKAVAERDTEIEVLKNQIVWLKTQQFGSTTEQKPFEKKAEPKKTNAPTNTNEAESQKTDCKNPEDTPKKRQRGQQPGSKGHGRTDRSQIETQVRNLEIEGCKCGTCGTPYRLLPNPEASPLTEIEIAVLRTVYMRHKYVSQCRCEGSRIVTAPPPPKLYPGTEIGNSIWLKVLTQRFLHGVAQNRILKDLELLGFHFPAGTATGGLKKINVLVDSLMEAIKNHCRGASLWNGDETSWPVAREGKWWLWLIASGDSVVYYVDKSRSSKTPIEFFMASSGVLVCDRHSAYKALQKNNKGIRLAWCWVHQRRDMLNLFKGVKSLKKWAKKWLEEITQLFVLNHARVVLWKRGETGSAQWEKAVEDLNLQVKKMKERYEAELKQAKLHPMQKTALLSLKRHWTGLTLFLTDPRIPMHNNRAERLIRNAVILRKNCFGSGAPWAGHLAAKIFSIFQTWLINGLDPQALMLDFLNQCSLTPGKPPSDLDPFLPWNMSPERKLQYALPPTYQRPG